MRLRSILIGVILLFVSIGTHYLWLFSGICVGIVGLYVIIRDYEKKKNAPRTWKTTPNDTRFVVGDVGKENVGFSREVYSDNGKR